MLQTSVAGMDGYIFGTGQDESQLLNDADLALDNVTIKGLTFTGTIESDGTFDGISVSVSQRGNITFDDCVWRDMISVHGVISASLNSYQVWKGDIVPPHSIQVNVVRSSFINIVYDWYVKGERSHRFSFCCAFDLSCAYWLNISVFLFGSITTIKSNMKSPGLCFSLGINHYMLMVVHFEI